MKSPFQAGEIFQNIKTNKVIFVLAVDTEDKTGTILAIADIDNKFNLTNFGELKVLIKDYKNWVIKGN